MSEEAYKVEYPVDAVPYPKFAALIGKKEAAVQEMVKQNKLPLIEWRDPSKPKARVGEKWIYVPEFNRAMREAFYNRPKE
ncbi:MULTISPECIES: Cox family DNA-binding protein [Photorhabdus]|nr:Cox family DNA-binding protein [Photorhabdus asymbiotica]RKS60221.1 regulatory phage protein cox [Photorhabdus asymbiotica]CAQ86392.1 probable bacteriophage cox protein [Photorhabdus asymbiotica]CAR67173.1 probable bacteriophage cox protein [Photorhabdus asymbiotica subsp. asymbiotica ATCC 43949]